MFRNVLDSGWYVGTTIIRKLDFFYIVSPKPSIGSFISWSKMAAPDPVIMPSFHLAGKIKGEKKGTILFKGKSWKLNNHSTYIPLART